MSFEISLPLVNTGMLCRVGSLSWLAGLVTPSLHHPAQLFVIASLQLYTYHFTRNSNRQVGQRLSLSLLSLSLCPSLKGSVAGGTGCGWLVNRKNSVVAFRIQTRNATSLRTRCYALAGSEQLFAITDNSLRKSDWLSDDNDTSSSSPWSITWTSSVILYWDLSISNTSSSHPFSRHLFTHSLFATQIRKKENTKLRESILVPET